MVPDTVAKASRVAEAQAVADAEVNAIAKAVGEFEARAQTVNELTTLHQAAARCYTAAGERANDRVQRRRDAGLWRSKVSPETVGSMLEGRAA